VNVELMALKNSVMTLLILIHILKFFWIN